MSEVRKVNKAAGRTCGNCGTTYPTSDKRRVACMHPRVRKSGQNEMNWYRKTAGGCTFWSPKNEDSGKSFYDLLVERLSEDSTLSQEVSKVIVQREIERAVASLCATEHRFIYDRCHSLWDGGELSMIACIPAVVNGWKREDLVNLTRKVREDGKRWFEVNAEDEFDAMPKKVWLDVMKSDMDGKTIYEVVDNRTGECFVKCFDTIDGAILYASDVKTDCEEQHEWDVPGVIDERGNLLPDKEEDEEVPDDDMGRAAFVIQALKDAGIKSIGVEDFERLYKSSGCIAMELNTIKERNEENGRA